MRILGAALVVLGSLGAALMLDVRPVQAKPEYTRRTKKDCTFCHPPGGYTLTDAGKYYRDHGHSLDGYQPPKPSSSHTITT